jgi:hypothetical protein
MRSLLGGVLVLGLALVSGCGGGGSDATGPTQTGVAGSWTMNIRNLTDGGGVICSGADINVTLTGSGTTFSGTYDGVIACSASGGGGSESFPASGTVVNGVRTGTQVAFDMDDASFHHVGTLGGSTMEGSETYRYSDGTVLTGFWSATRK